MLILLDCRPLQIAGPESEKSRLVFSLVAALARDTQFRWLLVADRSTPIPELPGTTLLTLGTAPGSLGWRLWYDRQIPHIAKKHKAGLVMTTGGVAAKVPLPQCIWMPERANPKEGRSLPPLYVRRLEESLHQAGVIFCYSSRDRDWLAAQDPGAADKLALVHPFPSGRPLTLAGREQTKARFAQGREYFLADASMAGEEGILYLLKAFSLFKKRQHSNLQLVIKGFAAGGLREKLETYKYREDIQWRQPSADDGNDLVAGAYAAVLLFDGYSLGQPVLDAWKSGVPVVGSTGGVFRELAGEAMLGVDIGDPASLASQLMSIYKDETLRDRLIRQGLTRVANFDPERTLSAVRSAIGSVQIGQIN